MWIKRVVLGDALCPGHVILRMRSELHSRNNELKDIILPITWLKAWFWQAKHVCGSVQFGSVRFTLVACAVKITCGSLWFNMASVDIKKFENKYDHLDNYKLQQHRRSSVAVGWYKKCITTASSTVGPYY